MLAASVAQTLQAIRARLKKETEERLEAELPVAPMTSAVDGWQERRPSSVRIIASYSTEFGILFGARFSSSEEGFTLVITAVLHRPGHIEPKNLVPQLKQL